MQAADGLPKSKNSIHAVKNQWLIQQHVKSHSEMCRATRKMYQLMREVILNGMCASINQRTKQDVSVDLKVKELNRLID